MNKIFNFLVNNRNNRFIGSICVAFLKLLTVEIPKQVEIGENVTFQHLATGTVIHPKTIIQDNVQIFQGVTIGRADSYNSFQNSKMKGIIIGKGAIIGAGAKVLCSKDILRVGENTIIGANAVLLESTGDNEIWGGIPAQKIGMRK